jgi:serine/threonine-protein kinase
MPDETSQLEEFPSPRDRAFAGIVVEMGLATRKIVDQALSLQVRCAFSGKEVPTLPQILVAEEALTEAQARRALHRLSEVSQGQPQLAPDADFSNTSKVLPALREVASLEDGPRIVIPASALKEPEPSDRASDADDSAAKLPPVPQIRHQPEHDLDSGTVEIIMPVARGGDTTVSRPEEFREAAARDSQPRYPIPATRTSPAEPISGYQLQARLSKDETGAVFRAKQIAMDRLVALKVLPPSMTADRAFVDRFLKEARDAGQLNHPNLVRVHEVGHIGQYYFYSMELVQGLTVSESIRRSGRMPPARALQVTAEMVRAVEHMSSKGIVHGEISPDAVTLSDEGAVKVLLAGLGRARAESTRFLVGERCHYVAPERVVSSDFDVRADLYSAGAVLYFMLTARHPYTGANPNQILDQHFSAAVPNPKEVLPELAAGVARVVTKSMRKNRTERFGSPADMLAAIDRGLEALKPRGTRRATVGTRGTRSTKMTGTRSASVRLRRRRKRRRRH